MNRHAQDYSPSPEERAESRRELHHYLWGYGLAMALTLLAFGLVAFPALARREVLWAIGACGLVQIIVHFRFFLHIDVSNQKREDLQLILFSTLILAIMISGTIWILLNLYTRMMPG